MVKSTEGATRGVARGEGTGRSGVGRSFRAVALALGMTLWLAACSSVTDAPDATLQAKRGGPKGMTDCAALYAAETGRAQVGGNVRYGELGTLILSFADDAFRARAIDWMDAHAGVRPGDGFGMLEQLPMLAVRTLVTRELVDAMLREFEPLGLLSIWADEPLEYFLRESVPFIGADRAQAQFGVTGAGVGVAVIDSGVDATHPDLNMGENVSRNVKIVGSILDQPVGGYLWVDTVNSDLASGHGTHVSGTIVGSGAASNGSHVGVAPGAHVVGVGTGDTLFILYALQGFDFVLRPDVHEAHNVRIISNSWGSSGRFSPFHPISLATKAAYDRGMMVVFAAGNAGPEADTLNPYSASPCAISVAAGDKNGGLANFSSRGIPGDAFHRPDITAPGVAIVASRAASGLLPGVPWAENPLYTSANGTSMATPHISGVLALMLEANPGMTFENALGILQATATPMTDPNGRPYEEWEVGAGYVDAYEAVREAVRTNRDRSTLVTTTLAEHDGVVSPAVCLLDCVVASEDTFTFTVPSGSSALRVTIDWTLVVEDLDLYVFDPNGTQVASSATLDVPESVSIPDPAPGVWTAVVRGYLNTRTAYSGVAEADVLTRTR